MGAGDRRVVFTSLIGTVVAQIFMKLHRRSRLHAIYGIASCKMWLNRALLIRQLNIRRSAGSRRTKNCARMRAKTTRAAKNIADDLHLNLITHHVVTGTDQPIRASSHATSHRQFTINPCVCSRDAHKRDTNGRAKRRSSYTTNDASRKPLRFTRSYSTVTKSYRTSGSPDSSISTAAYETRSLKLSKST